MNLLWEALLNTAKRYPTRPALTCKDSTISYNTLIALASSNPKTNPLILGPEKSIAWVISLLSALKHDSLCIFCPPSLETRLNKPLDELIHDIKAGYVFFTSGSTGKAKTVHLQWDGVVPVVTQQATELKLTEQSSFAWVLNSYFDASLSDIFSTLLAGAHLHISTLSPLQHKRLGDYIRQNKITHSDLPPSCLNLYDPTTLPTLKTIIMGGEAPDVAVLAPWHAAGVSLFNSYGPTETTVSSSMEQIIPNKPPGIGQPYKHLEFLKHCHEGFTPFTSGDCTEVFIAGHVGIATQYLGDPKLTNERFITLPDTRRCFKTGDILRYDGTRYLFVGRVDRQFKHNGVLVCPEEVETQLQTIGIIGRITFNTSFKAIELTTSKPLTRTQTIAIKKHIIASLGSAYAPQKFLVEQEKLSLNFKRK